MNDLAHKQVRRLCGDGKTIDSPHCPAKNVSILFTLLIGHSESGEIVAVLNRELTRIFHLHAYSFLVFLIRADWRFFAVKHHLVYPRFL